MTPINPLNELNISPKYGTPLEKFGRWNITSKGILIEGNEPEAEDFFIDNGTIHKFASIRELLDTMIKEMRLEAIDCQQFINAWFYKLSLAKINPDPDEPDLSQTLADIQRLLEKRFSGKLI